MAYAVVLEIRCTPFIAPDPYQIPEVITRARWVWANP